MEIRTCEEYVLNELNKKEEEVDRLKRALDNQHLAYAKLQMSHEEVSNELNRYVEEMHKAIEYLNMRVAEFDGDCYIKCDNVWNIYDTEPYKFLVNFFHLEECANDRTDKTITDD